jgi:hypothetical protein
MVDIKDFQEIMGEDLSGVTFVRDYLQLQFNPPLILKAYTPVTVHCGDRTACFGEPIFPNLLIGQLNKVVCGVEMRPDEAIKIMFKDGSTIPVSLRPEHYVGPEAINLFRRNGEMIVA